MRFKTLYLMLFIALAFNSCKTEINNENVSGEWKAKKFVSTIPDIPEEYAEAGEKEFLSSVYILNPDYSMEMRSDYFIKGAKGHWELNPDTKEISMFYELDSIKGVEIYIVKQLTAHELVLRQDIKEADGYVELTLTK